MAAPQEVPVVELPPVSAAGDEHESEPEVFIYATKAGDMIELPLDFKKPDFVNSADDREWLWEQRRHPFHVQMWMWLDRAEVSTTVQRSIVRLALEEQFDLFNKWFQAAQDTTPQE